MTASGCRGKALPTVYPSGRNLTPGRIWTTGAKEKRTSMTGLALVMFIALIAFGQRYFGWSDPDGKIQLMLFTTFILGVICGYKTKG